MYKAKQQTKFKVCNIIRTMLMNDTDVKDIVGSKIYPIIAPEGTTGDFITYARDEYTINRTKQGIYEQTCIVYVTCVSPSYDRSQELAQAVFYALDAQSNIVDNTDCSIFSIRMINATEDYGTDNYLQVLQFEIK